MRRLTRIMAVVAVIICAGWSLQHGTVFSLYFKYTGCSGMELRNSEADGKAEFYFADREDGYDHDLYCAALRISFNEPLTEQELASLKGKVNQRGKQDITLLNFSILPPNENLAAVDQLMTIGADPTLPLKRKGRLFYSSLMSDAARGTEPLATDIIALYLKHGGNPNLKAGLSNTPLVASTALMENFESFKLLVDHGADVWAPEGPPRYTEDGPVPDDKLDYSKLDYDNSAIMVAAMWGVLMNNFHLINYVIDQGALKSVSQERIGHLIDWGSSYDLRDNAISRNIVAVTRRIIAETNYPGDKRSREVLAYGDEHGW